MKDIAIMKVIEWGQFFGVVTTYAVSNTDTLEIEKEILLNKFQLN